MTIGSISNFAPVDYNAQSAHAQAPFQAARVAQSDSVQWSSAAKQALAAKPAEATETPAQTAQEALTGDPQALAKQAREKTNLT